MLSSSPDVKEPHPYLIANIGWLAGESARSGMVVVAALLGACVLVALIVALWWVRREQESEDGIWKHAASLFNATTAIWQRGDKPENPDHTHALLASIKELAKTIVIWRARLWLGRVIVGLVACIVAIAGTALLYEQITLTQIQLKTQQEQMVLQELREDMSLLYERRSCVTDEKLCSLDTKATEDRCEKQCPPAHDTRLRQNAAQAILLLASTDHGRRLTMHYEWDVSLDHARIPWLTMVDRELPRVSFFAADLRCANFLRTRFKAVSFSFADLRGAWIDDAFINANNIVWTNTICPDGTRAGSTDSATCRGHLVRLNTEICHVDKRPAPPSVHQ